MNYDEMCTEYNNGNYYLLATHLMKKETHKHMKKEYPPEIKTVIESWSKHLNRPDIDKLKKTMAKIAMPQ